MAKSPAFRFYPSDFMGSPDVQIMDLNEVGAYTMLLCTAWLQDRHGCLPDDENKLRRWARMTPQQWEVSKDILLGKFPVIEPGVRGNKRMIAEAEKQADFSAKQAAKGSLGGRPRKPGLSPEKPGLLNAKPDESQTKAGVKPELPKEKPSVSVSVSASVSSSIKKQKPSRGKREGGEETDERHRPFQLAFDVYYRHRTGKPAPWDGREAAFLANFLSANPTWTLSDWQSMLNNRGKSEVAHGEPLSRWISSAPTFAESPLDRFGKPLGGNNGQVRNNGYRTKSEITMAAAQNAARFDSEAASDPSNSATGYAPGAGIFDLLSGIGRVPDSGSVGSNRAALPPGRADGQDFYAEPWIDGDSVPVGQQAPPRG